MKKKYELIAEKTIEVFGRKLFKIRALVDIKSMGIKAGDEGGFLSATALSGKDSMEISVYGNDERIILVSRYDNLGKGASGAAVQCFNIMHGIDETLSLEL